MVVLEMKNVLLLGSSFSAVPLYLKLVELGYNVTVCGALVYDPLHSVAENSIFIDYSNKDSLLDHLALEKYDAIIPSCNEYAYLSGSYVADAVGQYKGFDSINNTEKLFYKDQFRIICQELNLSSPRVYSEKDVSSISADEFPLIVKPTDAFSGIGITKVHNQEELKVALVLAKTHSRKQECLIETFVSGSLHAVSVFIKDHSIYLSVFSDESCQAFPYQVDTTQTSSLSSDIKNAVIFELAVLISTLSLVDGLLHIQFMTDGEKFWFIESTRRCPGDLYGEFIKRVYGIDFIELYLMPFLSIPYDDLPVFPTVERKIVKHTVTITNDGLFKSIKFNKRDVEFCPIKSTGDFCKRSPYDKVGIIFAEDLGVNNITDLYQVDHVGV